MILHFESFFVTVFIIADDDISNDTSVIVGDTAILHHLRKNKLYWLRKKITFYDINTEFNLSNIRSLSENLKV